MKQNKCLWKICVLAIVLSLIYFAIYSKLDPIHVKRVYIENDDDVEQDEKHFIPVTLGTFEALDGSIFLNAKTKMDDRNLFATMAFDAFTDLSTALNSRPMTEREQSPRTIGELFNITLGDDATTLQKFFWNISQYHLYPDDCDVIDQILLELATEPIQSISQISGGTQFKLVVNYENRTSALFKPMRTLRDEEILPNQMYFTEFERHNAEIAAYHLDRVLGFRKAIPATGRKVNLITEILRYADPNLQQSFFISPQPDQNVCFTGDCAQYCDEYHPICGQKDTIEGSFVTFIPQQGEIERTSKFHPWKRSYEITYDANWETDPDYCQMIKTQSPFNHTDFLMELIEMSIFDFFMGNSDRHNYQIFRVFGHNSFALRYDHGRSFGNAHHDELRILAPLLQCCLIKDETLDTLLRIHNGPKPLSELMRESMADDPLTPILQQPHLDALDRRLAIVLHAVRDCINRNAADDSIIV